MTIDKIKELVDQLATQGVVIGQEAKAKRRERLAKLVDEHGYDKVAVAAGLTVGTLSVYLRAKYPSVSEKAVAQAEYVFSVVA